MLMTVKWIVSVIACMAATLAFSFGYAEGRKFKPPNEDQEKAISSLVQILGNENWVSIWNKRKELTRIKTRIIDVHPLQFLGYIFTNNNLIPAMKNMEGDKLVWGKFKDPLFNTLEEENKAKNVLPYVESFAKIVKIDSALLLPAVKKGDWDKLLTILMDKANRKGNPGRHNKL